MLHISFSLGLNHSENITQYSIYQLPTTEENYRITPGYKLNSEVTTLLGNFTVEPQSQPGQNKSSYR